MENLQRRGHPLRSSPAYPEGYGGRAASTNPGNRFEKFFHEPDPDWNSALDPAPETQFYHDRTNSIITHNDSPDIGFTSSFNPYRGCEHGCIYCYARPTHEYLGWSSGLDFESKILVKTNAPQLLYMELSRKNWVPHALAASGVTDCYQPIERRLQLTRACMEILAEFKNPVSVITKNQLIIRDTDLFVRLADINAISVTISVTTLNQQLSLGMEPRASVPDARLRAIKSLSSAGIPVGVNIMPIIPGLTDHEIPAILEACSEAGARWAGCGVVRLPNSVAPLFEQWLQEKEPLRKERVLARIREIRGGKLNDPRFGLRMTGEGIYARQIEGLFEVSRRKFGLDAHGPSLSVSHFTIPGPRQTSLFDR